MINHRATEYTEIEYYCNYLKDKLSVSLCLCGELHMLRPVL